MEPERPIEKLLRASATKRRDEAGEPLEMHAATRRLLQAEVARRFHREGNVSESLFSRLARLWPGVAWSVAVLAGLLAAASLMLPAANQRGQPISFAKMSQKPAGQAGGEGGPLARGAPAPARSDLVASAGNKSFADGETDRSTLSNEQLTREARRPSSAKDQTPASSELSLGGKTRPATSASRGLADRVELAKSVAEKETVAATPPAAPAQAQPTDSVLHFGLAQNAPMPSSIPAPPGTASVAGGISQPLVADEPGYQSLPAAPAGAMPTLLAAGARDRKSIADNPKKSKAAEAQTSRQFYQEAPPSNGSNVSDNLSLPYPVLASFEVVQVGTEVTIVDSDGSRYTGTVQPPASAAEVRSDSSNSLRHEALALKLDQPGPILAVPEAVFFRVAGTNRSLKQEVVFIGQILSVTNLNSSPASLLQRAAALRPAQTSAPNPSVALETRVSGEVRIGSQSPIPVKARALKTD
jgi:hypothetical protein